MAKFRYAVRKLKKATEGWRTEEDYPAIQALEAMAEELDRQLTSQILSQYGLTYRNLLSRKPQGTPELDPLEAALREAEEDRLPGAGPHEE